MSSNELTPSQEHPVMKYFAPLLYPFMALAIVLTVVIAASCTTAIPKPVVGKGDTVVVVFKPKKGLTGPMQIYIGAYTPSVKVVNDPITLKGSYEVEYKWSVKISDTTPDWHGHQLLDSLHHPIPLWSPVPDSLTKYLTIDTTGN